MTHAGSFELCLLLFRHDILDVGHVLHKRDLSDLQSGNTDETLNHKKWGGVGAYIINETLATKDVGEEARGILNV